jgi:hypothetical protein
MDGAFALAVFSFTIIAWNRPPLAKARLLFVDADFGFSRSGNLVSRAARDGYFCLKTRGRIYDGL